MSLEAESNLQAFWVGLALYKTSGSAQGNFFDILQPLGTEDFLLNVVAAFDLLAVKLTNYKFTVLSRTIQKAFVLMIFGQNFEKSF